MPGKSKKGGGLEVGSAYKMKGFSGFGNSPMNNTKKERFDKYLGRGMGTQTNPDNVVGSSGLGTGLGAKNPDEQLHRALRAPLNKRGKLTLKGKGSVKSRVEGFFSKFRKDFKTAFVGEDKMFKPKKKNK